MRKCFAAASLIFFFWSANGQRHNWQNLDLQKDSLFGISTEKAYNTLLKGKVPQKVIVAVIDGGIDIDHPDLKDHIWTNPTEIAGNGIDDDHNGYVDDLQGWNFLGLEKGEDDVTALAKQQKDFYDSLSMGSIPAIYRAGYQKHKEIADIYYGHVQNLRSLITNLENNREVLDSILHKIGKPNPGLEDFLHYKPTSEYEQTVLERIKIDLPGYKDFLSYRKYELDTLVIKARYHLTHGLNPALNDEEAGDKVEGNGNVHNDVVGLVSAVNNTGQHGTHVAGIIVGQRDNGVGPDGIADNAEIMVLKTNGNIRELKDETLARAIRYAADNGAKIINISLGKYYTWNKPLVDQQVKYAMHKGVLIVTAAMNNGRNTEKDTVYPNRLYTDGETAKAWIVVGASGPSDDITLAAPFSNYGRTTVDVFAPGVSIYSTLPGNTYASWDGTSMAAPVVSGLAALIWGYYPRLTAEQVKEIILRSVVKVTHDVTIKDSDGNYRNVPFSSICVSGGIVNAYNALQLAATYK